MFFTCAGTCKPRNPLALKHGYYCRALREQIFVASRMFDFVKVAACFFYLRRNMQASEPPGT